jgi:WD40 repeat protein
VKPVLHLLITCALALVACSITWAGEPTKAGKLPRTDRFCEPLPPSAVARLGSVRLRHGAPLHAVAISDDGKLLASAGVDQTIRIWDVKSGEEHQRITNTSVAAAKSWWVMPDLLRFSPPGDRLIYAPALGGGFLVCDVYSRKQQFLRVGKEGSRRHLFEGLNDFAFSPDGTSLATIDGQGVFAFWDLRLRRTVTRIEGDAHAVVYSPDGKSLLVNEGKETICVRDSRTARVIRRIKGPFDSVVGMAISPDGTILALNRLYRPLLLWDLLKNQPRSDLKVPDSAPSQFVFSTRGKELLAYADNDGVLRRSRLSTTQKLLREPTSATARQLERRTWGRRWASSAAFSRDGKYIVGGGDGGELRVWDPQTGRQLSPEPTSAVAQVRWRSAEPLTLTADGIARTWDLQTGRDQSCSQRLSWSPRTLSPDGTTVARLKDDGTLSLLDLTTGRERKLKRKPSERDPLLAFTPDGSRLIIGEAEGAVSVWDVRNGKQLHNLKVGRGDVGAVAGSPDGSLLAVQENPTTLHVLQLPGGIDAFKLELPESYRQKDGGFEVIVGPGVRIHFSANNRLMVVALADLGAQVKPRQWPIRVYETTTWKKVHELAVSPDWKSDLTLSPNGKMLAFAEFGFRGRPDIRLWEVASGKERGRLSGHWGQINSLTFSPDGRRLLSGSDDGTAIVWDVCGDTLKAGKGARANLDGLWKALARSNASEGYQAIRTLVARPDRSVAFLREKLKPVPPVPERHLAQLIADLDNQRYAVRVKATDELVREIDQASAALRKALASRPTLETRRRAEEILTHLNPLVLKGDSLRLVRAVEILEYIANDEARRLLSRLATGAPGARLTREARAALVRLAKRVSR